LVVGDAVKYFADVEMALLVPLPHFDCRQSYHGVHVAQDWYAG